MNYDFIHKRTGKKLDYKSLEKKLPDNRYRGTPEYWELHEETAKRASWQGRSIKEDELRKLPLQVQTTFALRCALRARYLLKNYWRGSLEEERCIDGLINFIESFSFGEYNLTMNEAFREIDVKYRECGKISDKVAPGEWIAHKCLEAIYDAGRVAARVAGKLIPLPNQYPPWSAAHSCHRHLGVAAFVHAGENLCQAHKGMEADFELLMFRSERENWPPEATIGHDFFAWHSEFDILKQFDNGNIREITQGWNAAFNDKYVHFPREIFEMTDDERHSFFSYIVPGLGFSFDLLLPSEKGRAYLIGISHQDENLSELLLLSRHAPGGKEAMVAINRLHGQQQGLKGNLLLSTAFLMKEPYEYELQMAPGMLSKFALRKKDFHSLSAWLSKHQDSELHRFDLI